MLHSFDVLESILGSQWALSAVESSTQMKQVAESKTTENPEKYDNKAKNGLKMRSRGP